MITLRVTRHDRNEALLAECQSSVIPARGEVLQLDSLEADGSIVRPSTMWRIVAVTVHVPSLQSAAPLGNEPRLQPARRSDEPHFRAMRIAELPRDRQRGNDVAAGAAARNQNPQSRPAVSLH